MYSIPRTGLRAANGTQIETPASIYDRSQHIRPEYRAMNSAQIHSRTELAAQGASYATVLTSSGLGGTRPAGLGFAFGDSWARTQRGVMEFSLPVGQVETINMAMRFSFENAFVAKALRLKTLFTTKGLKNSTGDDETDKYFDDVIRKLYLYNIFRQAVFMYYSVGLVPIILPEEGQPLDWVQLWDPRLVRVERAYGKLTMYLIPDQRMKNAIADKAGRSDPRNTDYYNAMPTKWRKQLENPEAMVHIGGQKVITLTPGSYIVLENRFNAFDRHLEAFDGCPLQPYFAHCENYRMLMAGDFATAFLAKNIIALVSIGDPKLEGPELYSRPDDSVLAMLENTFQNPQQAMWVYGDATLNVRYITPDAAALDNKKYNESKENLKNLLPGPFWYSEGGASFADATVELQWLEEEAVACQNAFDDQFWPVIYARAAEGKGRIAKKRLKPPGYDRSALRDRAADLQAKSTLYNNGGLDIKTLIAEHGYDPEVIRQKLIDQQGDVKKSVYLPAMESKQGIVAAKNYGLGKLSSASNGDNGKGGRPKKLGSKPQAESSTGRTPRKSERSG